MGKSLRLRTVVFYSDNFHLTVTLNTVLVTFIFWLSEILEKIRQISLPLVLTVLLPVHKILLLVRQVSSLCWAYFHPVQSTPLFSVIICPLWLNVTLEKLTTSTLLNRSVRPFRKCISGGLIRAIISLPCSFSLFFSLKVTLKMTHHLFLLLFTAFVSPCRTYLCEVWSGPLLSLP